MHMAYGKGCRVTGKELYSEVRHSNVGRCHTHALSFAGRFKMCRYRIRIFITFFGILYGTVYAVQYVAESMTTWLFYLNE